MITDHERQARYRIADQLRSAETRTRHRESCLESTHHPNYSPAPAPAYPNHSTRRTGRSTPRAAGGPGRSAVPADGSPSIVPERAGRGSVAAPRRELAGLLRRLADRLEPRPTPSRGPGLSVVR